MAGTAEATAVTATRVLLLDDRTDRRAVMRQMFEHSDVAAVVVGEADTASDAVTAVEDQAADVVVLDLGRDAQDGLDAVAALRARFPALGIIVCSFNTDAATRQAALSSGADAYLVKPVSAREVMAAASR